MWYVKITMSLYKTIKVILEFYYMSNGLTFEILHIILRIFCRCWDLNRKWPFQNFKEIGSELTEKSMKIMRSWFIMTTSIVHKFSFCTKLLLFHCIAFYKHIYHVFLKLIQILVPTT